MVPKAPIITPIMMPKHTLTASKLRRVACCLGRGGKTSPGSGAGGAMLLCIAFAIQMVVNL